MNFQLLAGRAFHVEPRQARQCEHRSCATRDQQQREARANSLLRCAMRKGTKRSMAFDQAIADQICEELANNSTSLREILKREGMPSSRQFYDWLEDVPKFAQQYARARERQGDTDADEVARVRRDVEDKKLTPEQGRVAIDALKWSAGKRSSKYNEKFVHQVDANVRLHVVDATLPK